MSKIKSAFIKSFMFTILILGATACFESDAENAVEKVEDQIETTTEDVSDSTEEAVEDAEEATN